MKLCNQVLKAESRRSEEYNLLIVTLFHKIVRAFRVMKLAYKMETLIKKTCIKNRQKNEAI